MSFPSCGPATSFAGAWTPDQDSVISGYTDASIYASLQRPTHLLHPTQYSPSLQQFLQSPQQQRSQSHIQSPHYSSPILPPGATHPRVKNSLVSIRGGANARSATTPRKHRNHRRLSEMTAGSAGDGGMGSERIEVQILPQDDNWGDNTTAITGNTSVRSESFPDISVIGREPERTVAFTCHRYAGSALCAFVALFAFLSPIGMILVPLLNIVELSPNQLECKSECNGLLINFSFKLLILLLGSWAVFLRQPKATMPRIFIFRALVTMLIFVFTFSYWLFFVVRVLEDLDEVSFRSIVYFAVSLVDALLFIHYLAIILLELRHLTTRYTIKVVRSPDGESRWYSIGQLSVQRASAWVLEKYYQDFPIYNPYLDRIPTKKKPNQNNVNSSFKYYDVDGPTENGEAQGQTRAVLTANARRRDSSHNERFYEEHEYDRRVKKRKARLITAAEEAFTHIKRLHEEQGPGNPMDPYEAAQSIFPSLARSLQKYLRITRQQPRHTMESILNHLAICLAHDMTPRAFLEKYLVPGPVYQNDKEHREIQSWGLVCDQLLSRPISNGTIFQLRQADVSLLCTISKIPHFSISEEIIHPKSNKFVLRLNSETSV